MYALRAARRYRWRLAGGRLIASETGLRFEPNRLERWRADTFWECRAEDVVASHVGGRMWLVIETTAGTETFRVFGATAVERKVEETLHPAVGVGT
jgi:hypothetical protein